MSWPKLHQDTLALLTLAGWKPWETKQMGVRERGYWVAYFESIEEHKRMEAVTQRVVT